MRAVAELDEAPSPDLLLLDAGLDSLMIVELRDRCSSKSEPKSSCRRRWCLIIPGFVTWQHTCWSP